MKKGFTLIELLAVIVILAIIALIATPIVLGIINDSKESAILRSAEFYVDAVKNGIMKKNLELNGTLNPEVCEVIEKYKVKCDEVEIEVEVDGEVPDSGTITFNRGKTISVELVFGERKVVTNASGELVLASNIEVCKLKSGNPNEIGSKYECEVKAGTKYNFYVLSHEEDGTTNLIMERNLCEDGSVATEENPCYVAWIAQTDYEEAGGTCWECYEDNSRFGPITAMNYINNATSSWNNIPNLNLMYDDEGENFTGFAITGKVRLPYHREVNEVGCNDSEPLSCPVWMVDYLTDAGPDYGTTYQENPIDVIWGYWTLSSYVDYSSVIWNVFYDGFVDGTLVDNSLDFGARPVINVKLANDVEENIPEPKSFSEDSWNTIAANVRAGNLSKYKVGDTKEITLTSDDTDIAGTYIVRIANTSTPSECAIEGFSQTACGFVIEFEDIISYRVMNSTETNEGGWEASEMRSYVNNEIYNAFPEELRKNIIDTYVVSGYEEGKTENYKTTDKVYLLSIKEVWEDGEDYDTAGDVTRQLDYYKQKGVTVLNNAGAIKNDGWWLRSMRGENFIVNYSGDRFSDSANAEYGVSVAFRL